MSQPDDPSDLEAVRRWLVERKERELTSGRAANSSHSVMSLSNSPAVASRASEDRGVAVSEDQRAVSRDGHRGGPNWPLLVTSMLAGTIVSTVVVWALFAGGDRLPKVDFRAAGSAWDAVRIPAPTAPIALPGAPPTGGVVRETAAVPNTKEPIAPAREPDAVRREAIGSPAETPVKAPLAPVREPTAAARPTAPSVAQNVPLPDARPIDLDENAQIAAIKRGEDLLRTGNVAQARLAFKFAANAGNADAALHYGDTYDPVRLAKMGVVGTMGDINQAVHWYGVADELGSPLAKSRLLEISSRGPAQ